MIPFLLDALTIVFIVAGLTLLWLNLRSCRRRTAPIPPPPEHGGVAPVDVSTASVTLNEEYIAGTSHIDIAASRAQAEECLDQADRSTSPTDREAWLRMAAEWIKLAEDAERRRSGRYGRLD
jgi:hypothetical protein